MQVVCHQPLLIEILRILLFHRNNNSQKADKQVSILIKDKAEEEILQPVFSLHHPQV